MNILTNAMSATDVKLVHSENYINTAKNYSKLRSSYRLKPNAIKDNLRDSYLTEALQPACMPKRLKAMVKRCISGSFALIHVQYDDTELGVAIAHPVLANKIRNTIFCKPCQQPATPCRSKMTIFSGQRSRTVKSSPMMKSHKPNAAAYISMDAIAPAA
ncbi:MAG: hypothetical protein U1E91_01450 [Moraxella sp.]